MPDDPEDNPPVRAASDATEAAMDAALQAAMAYNTPLARAKRAAAAKLEAAPMPPLAPILEQGPGTSPQTQQQFMSAVIDWSTFNAWLRVGNIEDLPELPRMLRLLYWFRADCLSEGVWYFISESWGGRYWADLRRACDMIGAAETLQALSAVEAIFPEGFPSDEGAMRATMDALAAMDPDPLLAIDAQYERTFREEIPTRLYHFLRDNAAEVVAGHAP